MLEETFFQYLKSGRIIGKDILDVTHMINQKIPVEFWKQVTEKVLVPEYFDELAKKPEVILTAKTSGPLISLVFGCALELDLIAASKTKPITFTGKECYERTVPSKTSGKEVSLYIPKDFFTNQLNGEKYKTCLITDDFLAGGSVSSALLDICVEEGLEPVGFLFGFIKSFDSGRKILQKKSEALGYSIPVKSVAEILNGAT